MSIQNLEMKALLIVITMLSSSCAYRDEGDILRFDAYRAVWDSMGLYPDRNWRKWRLGDTPHNSHM